ncbi:GAF domain-containing SpoIIE family protein phosphatase [Pararhodonellum marinum]|uniref:GAF domain-containing SpoIIE family protein phosphatase n=1 Tax=Pararhodonellum marinum TaxID=2755358 RepID=UPI00188ED9F4|nr:PP2C family protein-serine/threonine phosphatase [Pararhodonellum marinum]
MLKIPRLNIGKISLLVAILTWMALLFVDLVRLFGALNQMDSGMAPEISWALEIIFFILVFLFYRDAIQKNEGSNFLELIWKAASTGLIAMGISLLIGGFYYLMGESRLSTDPLLKNLFYHVNFALTTLFLISTTQIWRHLILYQKNKTVIQQWQAFEVILLLSMFFIFFNQNTFDYAFIFGLLFMLIFGVVLSVNLKWIPYLTFKEKWKSLLFLVIILVAISYLFVQLLSYSESSLIMVNLTDNLFLLGLFGFVFVYALFSFLVTLFNLPTSSVFEQKLTEAISFQRLSQSIQPGQNEDQVLDILVDSCMSASYADGAWLELNVEDGTPAIHHQRFISNQQRQEVREKINGLKAFEESLKDSRGQNKEPINGRLMDAAFKSVLINPLVVNKEWIGNLILLKEVKDGFNKEMVGIISTFVGQACISVENYRLLNEAIKNERYKEELQIAKRVQQSLLPSELVHDEHFEIAGFSQAADEVGGDYYDIVQLAAHRFALIIGDVSGKGTSAAFNMSQMKGVFHSLVQLDLEPSEFLIKANVALSKCLERNHFITTTYFNLDTVQRSIKLSRAGHCPTLYFDSSKQNAEFLSVDGMGLGIVRSRMFEKYITDKTFQYQPSDVMVLYTDGIIEAKNKDGVEFGYEKLKKALNEHHHLAALEIKKKIMEKVFDFTGSTHLSDDDYSILVIKFLS